MKKIMFNDTFGLTQCVIDGRKTQTRRIITGVANDYSVLGWKMDDVPRGRYSDTIIIGNSSKSHCVRSRYKHGDVVAVAQNYETVIKNKEHGDVWAVDNNITTSAKGFKNKMFVSASLMPINIMITGIRVERLQNISEADCISEGINVLPNTARTRAFGFDGKFEIPGYFMVYDTAKEAYAELIDKVSGKGTWDANPLVFVYDFRIKRAKNKVTYGKV